MSATITKSSIDLGIITMQPEAALKFYRDTVGLPLAGEMAMPGGGKMYRLMAGESVIKVVHRITYRLASGERTTIDFSVARPEVAPAFKVLRTFSERFATGLEYHGEWGSARKFSPSGEQAHTFYWIVERKKPFWMSLGLGYGLNRNSGAFSIKGSVEIPLD